MYALLRDRLLAPTTCQQKGVHCTDWNPATLHRWSIQRRTLCSRHHMHCNPKAEHTATIAAVATSHQKQVPEVAVFWVAALRLLVLAFPFFTALSPGPKEAEL